MRWNADGSRAVVSLEYSTGTSLLTTLDFQGTSLSLLGSVDLPQLGFSLALSPDGSLAATGNLVPGQVTLIDIASQSVVAEIATPVFVDNLVFSQDGNRLFATSFDPVLIEIEIQGGTPTLELHDLPGRAMNLNLDAEGRHAYGIVLGNVLGGSEQRFVAFDLQSEQVVSSFPILFTPGAFVTTAYPYLAQRSCDELVYTQTDFGLLWRFRLDGAESELLESRNIDRFSYGFDLSPELGLALVPYSAEDDELALYELAPRSLGQTYCTSTANSTGAAARLEARGLPCLEGGRFELSASNVPSQPYLFYAGDQALQLPFGNGNRCAGGTVLRLHAPALAQAGQATQAIDLAGAGLHAAGLWHFQCWFRDPAAGGAAFDLSDGVAVELALQ